MSEMFTQAANHDITYDMNYVCLVCTYVHVLLLSKRQKSIIELKSVQVFKNSLLCPYHPVSVFYVLYRGVVRNFERGQRASPPTPLLVLLSTFCTNSHCLMSWCIDHADHHPRGFFCKGFQPKSYSVPWVSHPPQEFLWTPIILGVH